MQSIITFITTLCLAFCLNSCDKNRVYEQNIDIPNMDWEYTNVASFEFEINDNLPKNLTINLRHSFHFGWRNIWLKSAITFPNDSIYELPLNVELSQPNGKWFGKCTGDICFYQYKVSEFQNYNFTDTGKYTFSIEQDMRQNPLPYIMSVGLRVENTLPKL